MKQPPLSITTWGAARQVSGSMHLLQTEKQRILLDCGLLLEKGSQLKNREFPFDPYEIDAVVLSHAHLDHCGNLPTLVRQGFRGPIYCTYATRDLLLPMLTDASNVQSQETVIYNHKRESDQPWLAPLYQQEDVLETISLVRPVRYDTLKSVNGDVGFQFREAGHALGSASVHLRLSDGEHERSMTFTGDVGRSTIPLLRPAASLLPSDLVLSEATYGGQVHESYEMMQDQLVSTVESTIDRGGKVLIPAFSLGRVQLVVHTLVKLIEQGRLQRVPIYVDSPLSNRVLDIMENHIGDLSSEVQQAVKEGRPFLHTDYVHYITTVEESKDVMHDTMPSIVVASSGMGEGGRIVHHLKYAIDDPRCTIVLVSFQTPGSLGYRLMEPGPTVKIQGREWNKWADVVTLRGFSGHADHNELMHLLTPALDSGSHIHLVHGEEKSLSALDAALNNVRSGSTSIAERGQTISISPPA